MSAAAILGVVVWALCAAMLWVLFGPLLGDRPVARALVALFWPLGGAALIAQLFIELLFDAGDRAP